jgi:hypothetical protein
LRVVCRRQIVGLNQEKTPSPKIAERAFAERICAFCDQLRPPVICSRRTCSLHACFTRIHACLWLPGDSLRSTAAPTLSQFTVCYSFGFVLESGFIRGRNGACLASFFGGQLASRGNKDRLHQQGTGESRREINSDVLVYWK